MFILQLLISIYATPRVQRLGEENTTYKIYKGQRGEGSILSYLTSLGLSGSTINILKYCLLSQAHKTNADMCYDMA